MYKKILVCLGILCFSLLLYGTSTESEHYTSTRNTQGEPFSVIRKATVVFDANGTETLDPIQGIILRIAQTNVGVDEDYDLSMNDENGVQIFAKTGIDGDPAASSSWTIFEDDTEGNPHTGVVVGGGKTNGYIDTTIAPTITLDTFSGTTVTVVVYYLDSWVD